MYNMGEAKDIFSDFKFYNYLQMAVDIYNKAFTDHSLCRHKGGYKCRNESRVK